MADSVVKALRISQNKSALAKSVAFSRLLHTMRNGKRPRTRKKLPMQNVPKMVILKYYKQLLEILGVAKSALKSAILEHGPELIKEAAIERGDSLRHDAVGKRLNRAFDQLTHRFEEFMPGTKLEAIAEQIGQDVSDVQKRELKRQIVAAVGVDVVAAEPNLTPLMEQFTAENVSLIKSIPAQYFDEVEKVLQRGISAGDRWEDIAEEIEDRFGVAESRAALIARDQVGKFFGDLNEARQRNLGVDSYIWRTVHDGRVRPEHQEYDGNTYAWDDPPADGHPGEAINCRCYAEPILDDILGEDAA